jgi:hypothetical protein
MLIMKLKFIFSDVGEMNVDMKRSVFLFLSVKSERKAKITDGHCIEYFGTFRYPESCFQD